ncbi:U3 small nucleolar RNA-associated protein 6 homolog [Watersipora subatra]|uniref:U3 small nucleolar RNA-associated protein 6 homolog n=1 Tax=Watersipora subatra TaxID=2589382 RepID=UPI00355B06F0
MAEFVQQTLEEMTNEVQQLERVGLFDLVEIKKMIGRRKKYEYKLRRRVKAKEDYLTYIKYEQNVLDLIAIRRKQDGYRHKKAEIEGAILQRILSLYKIACRNWPDSQELWLSRINFLQTKMRNKSLVSSTFNRMLKVITNKPNLWLMAAKYEFDTVYSMESARHIMQKALSFNSRSTILWHEFFRLELLFIDFVRRRQKLKEARLLSKVDIPKYAEDGGLSEKVMNGEIAIKTFNYALKELPDDLQFAAGFVDIAKEFSWTEEVICRMLNTLFNKFPKKPQVWRMEVNRFINSLDSESADFSTQFDQVQKKCAKLLKKMLKAVESEESWSVYLEVTQQLLELNRSDELESRFLLLLALADKKGFLSVDWMLIWIQVTARKGDVAEVLAMFKDASKKYSSCIFMWKAYIEYVSLAVDIHKAIAIFHRARKSIHKEPLELWQLVTQLATGLLSAKELAQLYEMAVTCDGVAGEMKEQYMHWIYVTQGIRKVRTLYDRLRQTVSVTENFYKLYIAMENSEVVPSSDRVRVAYRHLIHDYGSHSIDAWLEIIELERADGDVGKTSVLYSQAIKSLENDLVQQFIHKYTLLCKKTRK